MPINERIAIVRELRMVDVVIEFDDSNGTSKCAIEQLLEILILRNIYRSC